MKPLKQSNKSGDGNRDIRLVTFRSTIFAFKFRLSCPVLCLVQTSELFQPSKSNSSDIHKTVS